MSTTADRALGMLRTVRWYVHSVMGDNDYQRYCSHLRTHHPGTPVPTEKEFWREKHAEAERNPKTRCC